MSMEKRPPPTITNATIPSDPTRKGKNLRKIRDFYRGPYVFRNIISEREERIDRVPLRPSLPPSPVRVPSRRWNRGFVRLNHSIFESQ